MSKMRSTATDKPRDTKKTLMQLYRYLRKDRWLFALAFAMTICSNILQLLGPYLTGQVIDYMNLGITNTTMQSILNIIGWMVLFYLGSSLFTYLLSILMIHMSQNIVVHMREDLFQKFMDLPVRYFDQHQIGDLLSRMSYDIDTINTSLSSDVIQLLGSLITVIGSFLMMVVISPVLVLVFLVTIPASIYTTRYLARTTKPLYRKRSFYLGELNGYVEETISGGKTIKAYSQERTMIDQFKKKNFLASDAYYESDYYGGITGPSVSFINNISLALVSLFGSLLYLYQHITLGNISSFILFSRKFSGPINEAANIVSELQSTLAAAERVFRVLEEPLEAEVSHPAELRGEIRGEVLFDHVSFSYIKDKPIIKDLSLSVAPGSLVAIVGPTGAGKTTLVNLLMRFYDVDEGTISIDGINIQTMSRKYVKELFTMVLQDSWLFYGSIYDNIAYGNPGVSLDEVIEIAKEVNIHHFISRLPDGYDSLITDDGINISKGQKQLLTIARAMLQRRKMIILDEATSNVDTRTEKKIQVAMRKLMQDKTCFVIAHRLSTIQNADIILVVNDGSIVEQGNHQELMLRQGFYYELFMSQFQ